jgi:hypothetical protein
MKKWDELPVLFLSLQKIRTSGELRQSHYPTVSVQSCGRSGTPHPDEIPDICQAISHQRVVFPFPFILSLEKH